MSDGLGQQQASEGMEEYIPFDRDECKGRRIGFVRPDVDEGEEHMVGIFDEYTIVRGTPSCSRNTASDLIDANTMQSEPHGESFIMKNVGWAANLMGNKHTTKLKQVFQPTVVFSLHGLSLELEMGVLQHNLTICLGEGQIKEMLKRIGWNLREKAKSPPPFDECPTPQHLFLMNIII